MCQNVYPCHEGTLWLRTGSVPSWQVLLYKPIIQGQRKSVKKTVGESLFASVKKTVGESLFASLIIVGSATDSAIQEQDIVFVRVCVAGKIAVSFLIIENTPKADVEGVMASSLPLKCLWRRRCQCSTRSLFRSPQMESQS